MTRLMDIWGIDDFVSGVTRRSTKQEGLMGAMMAAMEMEMKHELMFKNRGRVTQFIRSTNQSELISHHYMIMKSLQLAVTNGKGRRD